MAFDFICVSIFSRKWKKISDCECPDLIQNETPVRFCTVLRKMFVLIGQNLHGTVTDVNQIDQHFDPFAASYHIVTKRPERFLFIVACFNIPA